MYRPAFTPKPVTMSASHCFRSIVWLFLVLLFSFTSRAQTHTARYRAINANCPAYYEYLPAGYATATQNFPVLIYCGGAGSFGNGSASQLTRLLGEGVPYYIHNNRFPTSFTANGQTASFIVISPQFIAWPSPADVEAVLNFISNQGYKADPSRIYLTGFSAGGDVTWKYPNTSVDRSKRLAALVPVAAYNYPYVDSGAKHIAAANLPVWALHSDADSPAPSYWSQNFVNKINSYNPAVRAKITRFGSVSHDATKLHVYNPSFKDGSYNIYEWMLLYRRNYPPLANAGSDLQLTLPVSSVNLNGGASTDPEGATLSFSWTKLSGPSSFSITNSNTATPTINNLVAGVYTVQLQVTDADGYTATDNVSIIVTNPNPNILPVARAGNDSTLTLPQNSVVLNGQASADADGSLEKYLWTQVSGPSVLQFSHAGAAITTVSNFNKGLDQAFGNRQRRGNSGRYHPLSGHQPATQCPAYSTCRRRSNHHLACQ